MPAYPHQNTFALKTLRRSLGRQQDEMPGQLAEFHQLLVDLGHQAAKLWETIALSANLLRLGSKTSLREKGPNGRYPTS